jgi:hypothetical protein
MTGSHVKTHRARRRLLGAGLLTVLTTALATFVFAGTAFADTTSITLGQGGTNPDGSCASFQQDGVPAGKQEWQFNLTNTQAGATLTASFSDGTSVTNKAEDDHNGNTSFWFIQTDLGAKLISATATFTPAGPGNSNLVVSHCVAGESPPPTTSPPTTEPPTTAGGGVTPPQPQAAVAVVSVPGFTG